MAATGGREGVTEARQSRAVDATVRPALRLGCLLLHVRLNQIGNLAPEASHVFCSSLIGSRARKASGEGRLTGLG